MANIDAQLMRLKGSFSKNAVTQPSEAQEKTGLSCKECQRLLRMTARSSYCIYLIIFNILLTRPSLSLYQKIPVRTRLADVVVSLGYRPTKLKVLNSAHGHKDMKDTARYFWFQAQHRKDAIDGVIQMIRNSQRPPAEFMGVLSEVDDVVVEWTIETVIQGAVLREYHHWETDTKDYFKAMHDRKGVAAPKNRRLPHASWVQGQLVLFRLDFPEFKNFDDARILVKNMKHEGVKWATVADFERLRGAVSDFWSRLSGSELR